MATIQRRVKTYGTRSYVAEVAAAPGNEDPILASEVDDDFDDIYAAWNGGADTVNVKDGAVTDAKIGSVGWNKLSGGTVAVGAGGDLAGTYPAPTIGAGKVTKVKLGTDVSGLVTGDFGTPNVGASTTALTALIDLSANATLSGRFYRLTLFGSFSKAIACDLSMSVWLGGAQVAAGIISTTAQGTESCLYQLELIHWFNSGTTYHSTRVNISGTVPAAPTFAPFARGVLRTGFSTGTTAVAPYVGVQFSVSNAGNGVARLGGAFEIL